MKYTVRWMVRALLGGCGASISMGAGQGSSWPFVPARSTEPGDLVTPWSGGPMAASRDWDPAAASASVTPAFCK
jgi:hypothetical protein